MKQKKEKAKSVKFTDFVNNKFVPAAGKIGNQTHLASIRDSFAMITPLIIAGAFAILVNQVFFGASKISLAYWIAVAAKSGLGYTGTGDIIFNSGAAKALGALSQVGGSIWWGSYAIFTLFITFLLGYLLGRRRETSSPIMVGIISLSTFFVAGGYDSSFYGTNGLFSGIIVSFLAAELYIKLVKVKKLKIKMPKQVPPSVATAFSQLIPVILTVLIFACGSIFLIYMPSQFLGVDKYNLTPNMDPSTLSKTAQNAYEYGTYNGTALTLVSMIYKFFTYPFLTLAGRSDAGLGLAVLYVFFVSFFWFFGLHGTNIMNGIFAPIWIGLLTKNTDAYISGTTPTYIFNQGFFDGFIFMGGWGAGFSLLLMSLLFSKDRQAREISKLAIAPGIFNINEPVTFGYPLMLNPILLMPAVLGPIALVFTTWLAIGPLGIVPKPVIFIPWISPPGIGGLLTTLSGAGFLLSWFNVIVGMVIYWPFIIISNIVAKKRGTLVEGNLIIWTKNGIVKLKNSTQKTKDKIISLKKEPKTKEPKLKEPKIKEPKVKEPKIKGLKTKKPTEETS